MSNTAINITYKKFINLQIEPFLNRFQGKIQLHISKVAPFLSFIGEGSDYEEDDKKLFIHDWKHFDSSNDNDYITHVKVEKSHTKLFEFIKKCVQKDIKSKKIKMDEGIKKEEWIKYFKQLINKAEYKDEYYQVFQEWPSYDEYNTTKKSGYPSYFNYSNTKNNSPISYNISRVGNKSLSDGETLKLDNSLSFVLPCVTVFLLFLVYLVTCCIKKLKDRTINANAPSGEITLPLVDIQYEEFQSLEL